MNLEVHVHVHVLQRLYSTVNDSAENSDDVLKFTLELKTDSPQDASFIERTLLRTSIIRKLYSRDQNGHCHSEYEPFRSDILEYLFDCIKFDNQLINFTASKALVCIMKNIPHKILGETFNRVIVIFLSFHDYINVAIYALQTSIELMKTFRKNVENGTMTNNTVKEKVNSCLTILCSQWENITAVLVNKDILSPLLLERYLSLCLECFRLRLLIAEDIIIMKSMTSSVLIIIKMVVVASSPFCYVRFTSLLRKMIKNSYTETVSALICSVDFQSFHNFVSSVLQKWFQKTSKEVYDMFVTEYNIFDRDLSIECSVIKSVTHLEKTLLRKYLLFSLEIISFSANSPVDSLCIPLCDLLSLLKTMSLQYFHDLSDKTISFFLQKLILHLILDEDGCLVGTLNTLFKLSESNHLMPTIVIKVFSIHHVFLEFISSIGYDNSTLLDFIISNETDFDVFFSNYLKLISSDNGGNNLTLACQEIDAISNIPSISPPMVDIQAVETATIDLVSSCDSEDHTDITEASLSADSDEMIGESSDASLDKLLNCFSRLYTHLENAKTRKLVSDRKIVVINEILQWIESMT